MLAPLRCLVFAATLLSMGAALVGCKEDTSPAARFATAQELFRARDPGAYRAWRAVPPDSDEGQQASVLLAAAGREYRAGLALLEREEPGARERFESGLAIAPIDPVIYVEIGDFYVEQGNLDRGARFYEKYLASDPRGELAEELRSTVRRISPSSELAAPLLDSPNEDALVSRDLVALGVGLLAGLLLAGVGFLLRRRVTPSTPLLTLVRDKPELHPAIAYLIGVMRHELLKHRIGATTDAVRALAEGDASAESMSYLNERLYGGASIEASWEAYLEAFERALGAKIDSRRDPLFRDASRSIRRVLALREPVLGGDAKAADELAELHVSLREFDQRLKSIAAGLVRSTIDREFLERVASEVRSEIACAAVDALQLEIGDVETCKVEVFAMDLTIILKNIVRNAILAVAEGDERHVRIDAEILLEPTGEELVRVRVSDSSSNDLTTDDIYARRRDRGLGLVTAALSRYEGSIVVEAASEDTPYAKAVVVQLFRAFDEDDDDELPERAA